MSGWDYDRIAWDGLPARPDPPPYDLVTAPVVGSLLLVVLSRALVGVWTHFANGRTVPCLGEACMLCHAQPSVRRRWHGYLACWRPDAARVVLAELTRQAVLCERDWLEAKDGSLRGRWVRLYRTTSHAKAPVVISLSNPRVGGPPSLDLPRRVKDDGSTEPFLPQSPDVQAALMRIWAGEDRS